MQEHQEHQDKLAEYIVKQGYTIYGGYVYKRLVNGDYTKDIDVHTKNKDDTYILAKDLKDNFGCKQKKRVFRWQLLGYTAIFNGNPNDMPMYQ